MACGEWCALYILWEGEMVFEEFASVAFAYRHDLLRCPFGDELPAPLTPFGSQVNHPISHFHDVRMVFDDQDRVILIDKPLQDIDELMHVGGMQPHGRLVENIECMTITTL